MININDVTFHSKIMVIEDKRSDLTALYKILDDTDYTIQTAATGDLVPSLICASPPDLFLLDARMPGLDDVRICRRIKANRQLHEIPVILLEDPGNVLDKEMGYRAGAIGYISQPYDAQDVLSCIDAQLKMAFFKNIYNSLIRDLKMNDLIWT